MTRLAQVTFALLALATFGAFFVAQRLKRQPPLILRTTVAPRDFSPNGDGVRDVVHVSLRLKQADDVSISVVNKYGEPVRDLVSDRPLGAHQLLRAVWNGRDDSGRVPPTGFYRFRLSLRRSGRGVNIPFATRLDNGRPHPVLVRVAGRDPRSVHVPLIVRAGTAHPIPVRFRGTTPRPARLLVLRTDTPQPTVVFSRRIRARRTTSVWDGTVHGAPAPPGIYRVEVAARSRSGTVGVSSPSAPGGGVTVRGVAVQPPLDPVAVGHRATVLVDARGRSYTWTLHRTAGGRVRRGSGSGVRLRLHVPGPAGLYRLTVHAGPSTAAVPLVVRPVRRRNVLVVLPAFAWAGNARVDDNGDGTPDVLGHGATSVRLDRPLTSPSLRAETRLLAHLDGAAEPYDITTDVALARHHGPGLARAHGVMFAGREDWLPGELAARLRRFVEGGGRVASFATQSLRRPALLHGDVLAARGGLRDRDIFAARFAPIRRRTRDLVVFKNGAGVFDTVGGLFAQWPAWEVTRSAGPGKLVAAAGPGPGTPVIVGITLGRGLVIRSGAVDWTSRLGHDNAVDAFTEQAWQLLAR